MFKPSFQCFGYRNSLSKQKVCVKLYHNALTGKRSSSCPMAVSAVRTSIHSIILLGDPWADDSYRTNKLPAFVWSVRPRPQFWLTVARQPLFFSLTRCSSTNHLKVFLFSCDIWPFQSQPFVDRSIFQGDPCLRLPYTTNGSPCQLFFTKKVQFRKNFFQKVGGVFRRGHPDRRWISAFVEKTVMFCIESINYAENGQVLGLKCWTWHSRYEKTSDEAAEVFP